MQDDFGYHEAGMILVSYSEWRGLRQIIQLIGSKRRMNECS